MSPSRDPNLVRIALPKGRMYDEIVALLKGAGISIRNSIRGYRPTISLANYDAKILKPRNVISMLVAGARDVGFAGADWLDEMGVELPEIIDTGLNPVRLVVAAPHQLLDNGKLPNRHLVIASEYPNMAERWIKDQGIDAEVLTTYGATEVFPPEDADLIIDNTATGSTLRANGLQIIDEIMTSSTRLYASKEAMANPEIKAQLDDLGLLLEAVLRARGRVMMDLNVAAADLDAVLKVLPTMRQPTISSISTDGWHSVRSAVPRKELAEVIPKLKVAGACDIVTTSAEQLIP
ncbi:ATP phosphoribosyltransferase [Mariniblastus fucicola]|uniref:ATP phosphoribosyltransferase n=1 Tax=Mariniblastus fucicola TaxID=980251 RepID=A0A5B9PSL9_9BACT|nr:ATP phosphoribosyltransferase [Mariniblastus fucicola]QEG25223.1 ATP phosphoribosyltransferase [Mariniblastus fucicola]